MKVLHGKKDKLLDRAKEHIFSMGIGDAASNFAQVNMRFGLAKMHLVMKELGLDPNATFISTPDETITRNEVRWKKGFGYGGKLSWGQGKDNLMFLESKPNACGMLVGGIDEIPKVKELLTRIDAVLQEDYYIKDVKIEWDFYKSNHFIDVFETRQVHDGRKVPPYLAILHGGCQELKGDNPWGAGLYWNKSEQLSSIMETYHTPFGKSYVLEGRDAKEYWKFYRIADKFAHKRRAIMYKELFGGKKKLRNVTHQGMLNKNEMVLGCQHIKKKREIFPVGTKADAPSFLVKGIPNLTSDTIERLGFTKRAERCGVTKRLRKVNLVPHGTGYKFPDALKINNVFAFKGRRYFEIDEMDGIGKKVVMNMREMQFEYRDRAVVEKSFDLGLCSNVATLVPAFTLKI